jgi:hypothetical protein
MMPVALLTQAWRAPVPASGIAAIATPLTAAIDATAATTAIA